MMRFLSFCQRAPWIFDAFSQEFQLFQFSFTIPSNVKVITAAKAEFTLATNAV